MFMQKLFFLTMGMFSLGFDAYVVAGLLPSIGASFKINSSQTGQLVSVFTICYALSSPILGTMLLGRPVRKILVYALTLFSIANGASALAPNYSWLLLARGIAGVGAGVYSPLAVSAAVSLISKEKRGSAIAITLGGMSIGTVIGVPLGLFTAKLIGWQGTLWLITIIGLIAILGLLFHFPNFQAQVPPPFHERISMLTNRTVLIIVAITFITSMASLGLYTYVASLLQVLGVLDITPYLCSWGIGGVFGSFFIGKLINRTERPQLLMGCILGVMALAMFSIPFVLPVPVLCYLPFFLWGAAGWASQAPQQHMLLLSQPNHGSAVVALNSSANYLGSAVGSMIGGIVLLLGLLPSQLSFATGGLVLVALLIQLVVVYLSSGRTLRDRGII
jgi:predicted MFS family arabinose efflux permease